VRAARIARADLARRELGAAAARWAAGAVAIVLATALLVWLVAPDSWQRLIRDTQDTDATVAQWLSIWLTNFVICAVPLLAGALAQRDRATRPRRTRALIAVTALIVLRSLVTIGLVGGLDPSWLLAAAPWWLLEAGCLGTAVGAGRLARDSSDGEQVIAQLTVTAVAIAGALAVAALVEVALT